MAETGSTSSWLRAVNYLPESRQQRVAFDNFGPGDQFNAPNGNQFNAHGGNQVVAHDGAQVVFNVAGELASALS